ncbi:DUF309 domain-containing protein [Paenibacillus tianjinensis]|uniref:DUF309 domain-containing protein n=1 Tax=Paenibacillus tianjinensis TaxID=2810347 RepID=A0ABX7LJX7_9BACL|nr:DUF309 domain-containing protein [Paenibacillus tianjinensis]QSF46825.1 DUF309 domain-containing protein [Paenibacillus tianjinensis]
MAYEPLYLAYLVYFNRDRDYFECHEVLEELWLAQERNPLYKALLQVAVGLYHFRNNNVRGAAIMMDRAHEVLGTYPGDSLGIDLTNLVREVRAYAEQLKAYEAQPFLYYDLTIDILDPVLAAEVKLAAAGIKPNQPQRRGPKRPDKAHRK